MQLKHPDTLLLAVMGSLYLVGTVGFWLWLGSAGWIPALSVLLVLVGGLQLHLHRVREQQDAHQLRQIQAITALHQLIPFEAISPWMTGWAATPEFAATLYDMVREQKPLTVVELGSGASTVVMAAALEQNGVGRLVSVDQDSKYAAQTRASLDRHGLSHRAEVVHAPLADVRINEQTWLWYDVENIPFDAAIDLLVIDGPHRELQKMARYPAIPLMIDRLSPDAVIVLDDADRKDEQRALQRWASEYDNLNVRFLSSMKGTAIITRTPNARPVERPRPTIIE